MLKFNSIENGEIFILTSCLSAAVKISAQVPIKISHYVKQQWLAKLPFLAQVVTRASHYV